MVSVIIPNYNHASFLNQRIESVLYQTYQDFELIILDDRSTDNSRDIIESYKKHPKVSHIVYNEINSGSTFKQWKKGIDLAQGDFIWIAESDDWADKRFLEVLIKDIDEDTAISFAQSRRVWSEDIESAEVKGNLKKYKGIDFIKERMLYFNTIENASMAIFSKKKVEKEWFDIMSQMKYCGDYFFWIKLSEKGNVLEYASILNYFRQHGTKVTNTSKKEGLDFIEGTRVLSYIKEDLKIKVPYGVIAYISSVWAHNRAYFNKGITTKTLNCLLKFDLLYIYTIPVALITKRLNTLKLHKPNNK